MGQIKEFLQGSSQDICLVENCGMDDERIVRSVEEISEDAGYYSLLIVKRQEKIEKAGRIMITFVGAGPGSRRSDHSTRTKTFERSRHRDLCGFSCEPGIT